ncbi:single-stranded-DNA-specific exonuclease RecJ [bacterium]|nr:single-stranded-DNA-specific exonuclease RecJ [bacterium]
MIDIESINILSADKELKSALAKDLNCSELLAGLLINRGVASVEQARRYFSASFEDLHDPDEYPGVPKAVDIISCALEKRQKLFVCGDYDVDGISASAILILGLRSLQAEVGWHLPHRFLEGFGLSKIGVEEAHKFGAKVLITVDCGSSNAENVAYAKSLGMKVIVTDHHMLENDATKPDAFVNANLPGHNYPFTKLCGAGVAWKLLCAVYKRFSLPLPKEYLDFVALATLCDMVPLVGENRTLAMLGLDIFSKLRRPCFQVLLQACKVSPEDINSQTLSFSLGPKLNACGRMDSPDQALELFLTQDTDACRIKTAELLKWSEERHAVEHETLKEIDEILLHDEENERTRSFIFVYGDWHKGVLGLCAQRLMDIYRIPCFVATTRDGELVGSVRTPEGYKLLDILSECSEYLSQYGGHDNAGGFTVISGGLERFAERLRSVCERVRIPLPMKNADAILPISSVSMNLVRELKRLEPVGKNNEQPLFFAKGVKVCGMLKAVGRLGASVNFRVCGAGSEVRRTVKAVAFNKVKDLSALDTDNCTLDILYSVEDNTWGGSSEAQIVVKYFAVRSRFVADLMPPSEDQTAPFLGYPEGVRVLEALRYDKYKYQGVFCRENKIIDGRNVIDVQLYLSRLLKRIRPGECICAVADNKTAARYRECFGGALLKTVSFFATYDGNKFLQLLEQNEGCRQLAMLTPPMNKEFFSGRGWDKIEHIHILFNENNYTESVNELKNYHLDRDIVALVYRWAAKITQCGKIAPRLSGTEINNHLWSLHLKTIVLKRALQVLEQLKLISAVWGEGPSLTLSWIGTPDNAKLELTSSPLYRSASVLLEDFKEVSELFASISLNDEMFFK